MRIKTAETARSDSGLVAQFEFEFLPPPPPPLPFPFVAFGPLSSSFNAMRTLCEGRRGQCHVFIFEIGPGSDDDGDGKSFIEGEAGSQGRRQWRVHLAFEEIDTCMMILPP